MADLVEIGEFHSLVEAELAKGKLESYGVEAILANTGLAQIYPGATLGLGGIKLLVQAKDAKLARSLLLPGE